jgi:regulator of RNase E activity RraA
MTPAEICSALTRVCTATITMQLIKRGIRRSHICGPTPLVPGQGRVAGPAFTVSFIPAREDVATRESYARPDSLRSAIEAMPAGAFAVFDARGEQRSGTTGDILALAMRKRGVVGFVSDGPVRDVEGLREVGLPVWSTGSVAPPSIGNLYYIGYGTPIGCGGVAVFPGDYMVADDDGVVVVPADIAADVAHDGAEQERFERFAFQEVERLGQVTGIYPPDEATLQRYAAWIDGDEDGA